MVNCIILCHGEKVVEPALHIISIDIGGIERGRAQLLSIVLQYGKGEPGISRKEDIASELKVAIRLLCCYHPCHAAVYSCIDLGLRGRLHRRWLRQAKRRQHHYQSK